MSRLFETYKLCWVFNKVKVILQQENNKRTESVVGRRLILAEPIRFYIPFAWEETKEDILIIS